MNRPHQLTWAQLRAIDHERELQARMDDERRRSRNRLTASLILLIIVIMYGV